MNNKSPITQLIGFAIYFLLQLILFRNLWLFSYAHCWLYIAPLLLLPKYVKDYVLLFVAFILGLTLDVFYDKLGVNAAACVLLAYARPWVIQLMAQQGNEDEKEFNLKTVGFSSFSVYVLILVFIHHTAFYLINTSSLIFLTRSIVKIFASTIFTYLIITSIQMLYYMPKTRR